jgi:ankyrin repeat protein
MKYNLNTWIAAVIENNLQLIKKLINDGIDVNLLDEIGYTALHWASTNNNLELVDILIKAGANVNSSDCIGRIALHIASEDENLELVKLLIKAGSNLNVKNTNGYTPLQIASKNEYLIVVKTLIEAGAQLDPLTIKKYGEQLGQEMVNNIKKNVDWQWIRHLPQSLQQHFPEHLRIASQMGLYD